MEACVLCGRAVVEPGSEYCCPGCAAIAEIVTNLQAGDAEKQARVNALLDALFSEPVATCADGRETQSIDLAVSGMVCPACAWIIHYCVSKLPGVSSVTINFMSEVCQISFDPMVVGRDRIEAEIENMGYGVYEGEPTPGMSVLQLGLGWFYALNAMMLSFVVYSAEYWQVPGIMAAFCAFLLVVFTALTVLGPGRPTLTRGWKQIWARQFRMESLIALSTGTAFVYSCFSLVTGHFSGLYFDVVCLLLMLLETGSAIETGFYQKVRRRVHALRQCLPKKLRTSAGAFVPLDSVCAGARFSVATGEVVPTDGILESAAEIDFSHITGESRAVSMGKGRLVGAGSRLLSADATLRIPDTGLSSMIDRMIQGTISAFDTRAEQLSLGDRISQWFVPVLILVALLPLVWFGWRGDLQTGLLRFMAVLVVSCPCAFGIAEPLVLSMAVDRIRHLGLQIFNGNVLRLQPDTFIFDKTGTLTIGDFVVKDVHWQVPENQESLDILASLETGLDHPIARALSRLGKSRPVARRSVVLTTVTGRCGGRTYRCGKPDLYPDLPSFAHTAGTLVAFGDQQTCHLVVTLVDEVRPESEAIVAALANTHLCSGDHRAVVEDVGRRLGVDHLRWGMSVEDKLAYIRELQEAGRTVMMVGDGVNDAQALAAADIGLAVVSGEMPAKLSADGAFLVNDISGLVPFVKSLSVLRRRIYQNYFWSFLYNAVGVSLAMAGLLSPTFCAFGMVFSNSVVIANSVRRLRIEDL